MSDYTDVVEKVRLPPDAGLVKSLGAHHTLNSAIADLIDTSIDASATRITIRLLTADDRLDRVEVLDDGHGMDDKAITAAMTLGHQRDYVETDLGHFGIGMKAASFAHADALTVWSEREDQEPVGRRIRRTDFSKDFSCEVLSTEAARLVSNARRAVTAVAPMESRSRPASSTQRLEVDRAIIERAQPRERAPRARLVPSAMAGVEHELLLDVVAPQRLVRPAAQMRLTLLDGRVAPQRIGTSTYDGGRTDALAHDQAREPSGEFDAPGRRLRTLRGRGSVSSR